MSDAEQFIKGFNRERKANKGKWITFVGSVNGHDCWIKSFDTWIQRAEYRGMVDSPPVDCKVREMNEWLAKLLNYGEA